MVRSSGGAGSPTPLEVALVPAVSALRGLDAAVDRNGDAVVAWEAAHPLPHAAALSDVADHIDHVRKIAGIDHVGIGGDYEGFDGPPEGLEDVSCYPALLAELLSRGYTKEEVKKVAGLNVLRVLRGAEETAKKVQSGKYPL